MKELISELEALTGPSREVDARIAAICSKDWTASLSPMRYSESIDAAMTLVPEGFAMLFSTHGRQSRKPFVCCSSLKPIDQLSKHLPEKIFNVEAETLPLALCLAALRARAALEGTK